MYILGNEKDNLKYTEFYTGKTENVQHFQMCSKYICCL